jgi:hypothetical protein
MGENDQRWLTNRVLFFQRDSLGVPYRWHASDPTSHPKRNGHCPPVCPPPLEPPRLLGSRGDTRRSTFISTLFVRIQ